MISRVPSVGTYPWPLLNQLAGRIEHAERPDAHARLDEILDIIGSAPQGGLTLRKLRCAQVISLSLRGAHHGGAASQQLLEHHIDALQELAGAPSWKAACVLMHQYVDDLVDRVRPRRRVDVDDFVLWMCSDMRTSLESGRTLANYADLGGLSVGHLSRTFKQVVGRSFRAEQRRARMEEAQKLLDASHLKVHAIVRRLGLQDASQFSRDFKQWTGLTPMEYRRLKKESRA